MKIEKIYSTTRKAIFHETSSGMKEIKRKNKTPSGQVGDPEILAYIENYINESGFELFEILLEHSRITYFLVKK